MDQVATGVQTVRTTQQETSAKEVGRRLISSRSLCGWNANATSAHCLLRIISTVSVQIHLSIVDISNVPDCTGVVDIVVVLDVSGSIESERFPMVKELVVKLLQDFDIGPNVSRVAAIYFSDNASVAFYLNSYSGKQVIRNSEHYHPLNTLPKKPLRHCILPCNLHVDKQLFVWRWNPSSINFYLLCGSDVVSLPRFVFGDL